MMRQRASATIRVVAVLAVIFAPAMLQSEPTLSGANYFGDSANAIIDAADILQIKNILAGAAVRSPPIFYDNMRLAVWLGAGP